MITAAKIITILCVVYLVVLFNLNASDGCSDIGAYGILDKWASFMWAGVFSVGIIAIGFVVLRQLDKLRDKENL